MRKPSTPRFSAFLREVNRLGRAVGAGAGKDLHAMLDHLHGQLDHAQMFLHRRAWPIRPVVPTGMTPSMPAAICSSSRRVKAVSST